MLLIKILIFTTLVIIIPLIVNFLLTRIDDHWNGVGFALGVLLFFVWLIYGIFVGSNNPTKWVVVNNVHLTNLSTNTYIKQTTSKTTITNSTQERFDYDVNESSGFRSYWVTKDNAAVKLKDGALDLEIQNEVAVQTFAYKYIIPHWFVDTNSSWYTFYVDPKYAKDNLGIEVK